MSHDASEFGAIVRRFLAGELTRPAAAEALVSTFELAGRSNAKTGFSIDFNNPDLSDDDRRKLQDLWADLQTLVLTHLARSGGTA